MFEKINIDLGSGYQITALKEKNDISVSVTFNGDIIGQAHLTTDYVDVICVTSIAIDDKHVNHKVTEKHTLGDTFIKFLIKFPSVVRKAEFRFILDSTENLSTSINKYHFERSEESNVKDEILIRKTTVIPHYKQLENIKLTRSIDANELPSLLAFLKKNAYWQKNLTLDRLALLTQNALCFCALTSSGEIVGFARVVTDGVKFASLWDVAVDEDYRGQGIAIALMGEIFSDAALRKIPNWILFTDSAKKLYQKFGFVSESEASSHKWVHKLRFQETSPSYMPELISVMPLGTVHLNPEQSLEFLFGNSGNRQNLSHFWKSVIVKESEPYQQPGDDNKNRDGCCFCM